MIKQYMVFVVHSMLVVLLDHRHRRIVWFEEKFAELGLFQLHRGALLLCG